MKRGSVPQRQARRVHRWLVPIAAAPLLLTAISGSMYSVLLEQGIDAFWLLKIHTGRFGWLNLESFYPAMLGLLTVAVSYTHLTLPTTLTV